MKIKKLNLTLNYPISWQKDKVLRDYIQNFYDATEMDKFKATFDELYEKIKTGDREGMRQMMRTSTERRKRFDKNILL